MWVFSRRADYADAGVKVLYVDQEPEMKRLCLWSCACIAAPSPDGRVGWPSYSTGGVFIQGVGTGKRLTAQLHLSYRLLKRMSEITITSRDVEVV